MKILFISNKSFSEASTSEHLMSAIIARLAEQGHSVCVFQMLKPEDPLVLPESWPRGAVKTEGIRIKPQNKNNFAARYIHAAGNYLAYRRLLHKHRDADAVFLQSTNVAGLAVWLVKRYLKNARITYNVQDIFPYNLACSGKLRKNGLVFKTLAAVQRYGYKHSDHIITISEDMKDTLVADGTPADKIEVVYNWSYQDELYENLDLTPVSHMFSPDTFNVVYAGNIGVMQNVDILIEAAKLMKDDKAVWFHIIGNGVYKDKLETRAKEYGITNISFWPMQPAKMAPLIYSAADVNIIPLVKDVYRTALPSKTATCLACRKPTVFAIGKDSIFGQRVRKEAGCPVIEADDAEELVRAIQNTRAGEKAALTGEFFLKNFGITENSRKYAEIITRR